MNRVILLTTWILVTGFLGEAISAAEIELSGFCDLQYVSGKGLPSEIDGFQYGQFEFDASAPVNRWITLQGALALNQPQEKFEPGEGYIDLNFLDIGAYKRLPSKHAHIRNGECGSVSLMFPLELIIRSRHLLIGRWYMRRW